MSECCSDKLNLLFSVIIRLKCCAETHHEISYFFCSFWNTPGILIKITEIALGFCRLSGNQPNDQMNIWIRCKDWRCVVLREIDFLLKDCNGFLACFTCGVKLLEKSLHWQFCTKSGCYMRNTARGLINSQWNHWRNRLDSSL